MKQFRGGSVTTFFGAPFLGCRTFRRYLTRISRFPFSGIFLGGRFRAYLRITSSPGPFREDVNSSFRCILCVAPGVWGGCGKLPSGRFHAYLRITSPPRSIREVVERAFLCIFTYHRLSPKMSIGRFYAYVRAIGAVCSSRGFLERAFPCIFTYH